MTKTMKNTLTPVRRRSGFTLIEMLVVAALIAIFAGLAVFNIVEQLNREKEKAALSEARSIATAMSFAYDDLGFFPKLCFLRFGVDELRKYIIDENLPADAIDWFDRGGANMGNMISSNWGEKYMSGSMPDKFVTMQLNFRNGGSHEINWPSDPFNQPYMAYLLKMETPDRGGVPVVQWADDTLGDKPNYFAGIVSYGRNKVPGYAWNDPRVTEGAAMDQRLYVQDPANQRRFAISPGRYNQARLDFFVNEVQDPDLVAPFDGPPPHPRQAGSDDKYFEF